MKTNRYQCLKNNYITGNVCFASTGKEITKEFCSINKVFLLINKYSDTHFYFKIQVPLRKSTGRQSLAEKLCFGGQYVNYLLMFPTRACFLEEKCNYWETVSTILSL